MANLKKLSKTEINNGIITTRKGSSVRDMLPGLGQPVVLKDIDGRKYELYMHKSVAGRIDGLTQLYRDYNVTEGDFVEIDIDAESVYSISFWHLKLKKKSH